MTARSPAEVIAGALRVQGDQHPDIDAKAVMAALKGHGYRIVRDTAREITYCPIHTSSKMPCGIPHEKED